MKKSFIYALRVVLSTEIQYVSNKIHETKQIEDRHTDMVSLFGKLSSVGRDVINKGELTSPRRDN